MTGNEELKKMLRDLMIKGLNVSNGSGAGLSLGITNPFGDFGKFRPPLPSVGVDGDI